MSYQALVMALKGGPGSGNWGHSGRPGKRGGSAPKSSVIIDYKAADPQELNKYYALQERCGTEIDCEAVRMYTHSGYDVVNMQLRRGNYSKSTYASEWRPNEVKELLNSLDKTFKTAPTVPENIIAYRGVAAEAFAGLKPGDKFIDKGFVSTTLNPDEMRPGIKVEMRIPKGTKGIYVEKISAVSSEMELLLNRGTKFKLVSYESSYNKWGNLVGNAVVEVDSE